MSNLTKILKDSLIKYNKRLLVSLKKEFSYDRYTYNDIYKFSLKFITFLKENNIKPKDKIAICSYNCPQYFYIFLGALFHGVTLVPIDFGSSEELINKFIKLTNAKILITSQYKLIDHNNKFFVEEFDSTLKQKKIGNINTKVNEHDLAQILFTSGTTGEPKGVMITHENIYSNAVSALSVIKINKTYKMMSIIPLSHTLEQIAGFFGVILSGARTTQLKSRRSSEMLKVMQHEKINCLITVPAFFNLFKNKIEEKARKTNKIKKLHKMLKISGKLPIPIRRKIFNKIHKVFGGHLTTVMCGGASLPIDTQIFWEAIGTQVLQGYGLTETSPILTLTPKNKRKLGSVGKAIPGVTLKIDETNEILAKGKNITPGYYKNPKATNLLFSKNWLRTGDLGELDEQGFLFIKGRLKNMILKADGLNVYPEDIEKILNKEHLLKDSCVLGVQHSNDVVITAILLFHNLPSEKKIKEIIKNTNLLLEKHQKIQNYLVWDKKDFPRTLTLKKKRNLILNQIQHKEKPNKESDDELLNILATLSHLSPTTLKENSLIMEDLGFDSLKIIELSTILEDKMDVEIDEYLIDQETTISKLRQIINSIKKQDSIKLNNKMFWPIFKPIKIIMPQIMFLLASRFFTTFKVNGLNNLKNIKGPIIIASNHTSHLDVLVITKHIPLNIRTKLATGAAADYFFKSDKLKHKIISSLFSVTLGAFPISRGKNSKITVKKSFEFVGQIIDKGWSIALFPEGTRTTTGKINPFKTGIGIIIKETNLPVLPVHIKGLFEIMPKGSNFPIKKGPVSLSFGKPIYFDQTLSVNEITNQLEDTIKSL